MKTLTKMHLINWHYIQLETLVFSSGINYFTGGSGSGKSTTVDAMQLVLLGNPRGNYFNQAADDDSKRSLIEYLCGMKAENEEKKTYLRDNINFSTYDVLEFYDEEKKTYFCIGIVFDVNADKKYDHVFFHLNSALPDHQFLNSNKTPMNIAELKAYYKGKDLLTTFSDTSFRDELCNRILGRFDEKFFTLFRKAVNIKPTNNIKELISKFVCEEQTLDIDEMQEKIRSYKSLEIQLSEIERRVEKLKDIEIDFARQQQLEQEDLLNRYMLLKADSCLLEDKLDELTLEKNTLFENQTDFEVQKQTLEEQESDLEREKEELGKQILSAEVSRRQEELTKVIHDLENTQLVLERRKKDFLNKGIQYQKWLTLAQELGHLSPTPIDTVLLETLFTRLNQGAITRDELMTLYDQVSELKKTFFGLYTTLNEEVNALEREHKELQQEAMLLKQGLKTYPKVVTDVKRAIEEELSQNNQKSVEVYVLADLLEIRNKTWTNVIEGYFKQKLALIIHPQYCLDAIRIYRSLGNWAHGVDVIDTQKMMNLKSTAKPGSLAEEIETSNPYARNYVDYLLGNVMKCSDVNELNQYRVGITQDGMLYRNFSYAKLDPHHSANHYIGNESMVERVLKTQEQLNDLDNTLEAKKLVRSGLSQQQYFTFYALEDIDGLLDLEHDVTSIPDVEIQLEQKKKEYMQLDLTTVVRLEERLDKVKGLLKENQCQMNALRLKAHDAGRRLEEITVQLEPALRYRLDGFALQFSVAFDSAWMDSVALPVFEKENQRLTSDELKVKYEDLTKKVKAQVHDVKLKLKSKRHNFNMTFNVFWDESDETNQEYNDALTSYEIKDLPLHIEKVKVEKEKAYEQFTNDFVCKLKDRIQKTELQIIEINRAIKNIPFGKDQYEFKVSPTKQYKHFYDMLTDDTVTSLQSVPGSLFEEHYKDRIEELFSKITETGNTNKETLEQNIRLFSDYRTYLDFDMIVKTGDIESSLSKTMAKSSGGERQNPYYIAVLAAFIELYQMNHRMKNNTNIRLIIFDEAFSKMGDENIHDAIRLIRDLGFQCILVAPDDVISLIAPEADKTFCFANKNKSKIIIVPFEKDYINSRKLFS